MKLAETNLPQNYSKGLFEEKYMDLDPSHTDKMFNVLFTGAANLLNDNKSMEQPVAFVMRKADKAFIAASIVQFFKNEDDKNPGNWSLVWTFNEADVPENAVVINFEHGLSHSYFIACGGEKYGIQFKSDAMLMDTLSYTMIQLKKWLDENAKDGAEVSIECDGVFQARVKVENGEKVFAVEADGEIKNLIKSDAMIEK